VTGEGGHQPLVTSCWRGVPHACRVVAALSLLMGAAGVPQAHDSRKSVAEARASAGPPAIPPVCAPLPACSLLPRVVRQPDGCGAGPAARRGARLFLLPAPPAAALQVAPGPARAPARPLARPAQGPASPPHRPALLAPPPPAPQFAAFALACWPLMPELGHVSAAFDAMLASRARPGPPAAPATAAVAAAAAAAAAAAGQGEIGAPAAPALGAERGEGAADNGDELRASEVA
jgi:hypothetical protein